MTLEIWNTNLRLAEELNEECDTFAEEDLAFFDDDLCLDFEAQISLSLNSEASKTRESAYISELVFDIPSPPPDLL